MKKTSLAILGGRPLRTKPFPRHPVLGKEERGQVASVLKSGLLSGFIANAGPAFLGGPKTQLLENEICRYFKVPYAVAMNSATSALHAALAALGIGPGDEVIVTPYTMSASASVILMQQAIPVFADIDEKTFCLDPKSILKKITPRTRALVVVHLFGQPAPMEEILRIAQQHHLAVIEDCAQSPGARFQEKYVGTLGHIGVFSLNQHKTITTGEGGFAITRDEKLAMRLRLVRNHGEVVTDHLNVDFDPGPVLGWNYRITELDAAVGVAQFRKLDYLNRHRIRLAEFLIKEFSKIKGFTSPYCRPYSSHVYFLLALKYDEAATGIPRDLFIKAVNTEGISMGAGYVRPIYLDRIYRERKIYLRSGFPFDLAPDYQQGDCPVAEEMYFKKLVTTNLCRYPLSIDDMKDVVQAVRKVLDQSKQLLIWAKSR